MAEAMMRANRLFAQQAWLRVALDTPFWWMAFIALATRSLYQTVAGWQEVLVYVLGHAIFYRALYWLIAERFSPWKIALLWLGSPLLLFSATWLRPVWALVFTAVWGAALWWSIRQCAAPEKNASEKNNSAGLAGYLVVLAWVSVCGAGGYGYQSSDYVMHNGRLLDLIHYTWPVSYANADGSFQLLVQYAGYYLWPALIGKIAGISAAMLAQHLWLLAGCWLALRMMALLTRVRSWVAAIGVVFFGGWDVVVGLLLQISQYPYAWGQLDAPITLLSVLLTWLSAPPMLDFWPATDLVQGMWFGNFTSLASSLLWAPHQTVAGWLVVGLLCQAAYQQKVVTILFACALLAYYAPMIALGLLPLVLILLAWQFFYCGSNKDGWLTALVGVSVLGVLGVYYASVSVSDQPYGVLPFLKIDKVIFLLFLLKSWCLYVLVVVLYRRWLDKSLVVFAVAVFVSAVVLSCVYYGVYNDLMVRSSSAIYFGVLLVLLAILRALWSAGAYWRAGLLLLLLLPSAFSGVSNVLLATLHADVKVAGKSIPGYMAGWQFMGRNDSWFVRYLSADFYPSKNE